MAPPSIAARGLAGGNGAHPGIQPGQTPVDTALGVLPEVLRTWPGTRRSAHPCTSFAAVGHHATDVTMAHALSYRFGKASPLYRLYELDAKIVQIGVGWDTCTSFHLAEALSAYPGRKKGMVLVRSRRGWERVPELVYSEEDYERLAGGCVRDDQTMLHGHVGAAAIRVSSMRAMVDLAVRWLVTHRDFSRRTHGPGFTDVVAAGSGTFLSLPQEDSDGSRSDGAAG